jgi:hypothetical protein
MSRSLKNELHTTFRIFIVDFGHQFIHAARLEIRPAITGQYIITYSRIDFRYYDAPIYFDAQPFTSTTTHCRICDLVR